MRIRNKLHIQSCFVWVKQTTLFLIIFCLLRFAYLLVLSSNHELLICKQYKFHQQQSASTALTLFLFPIPHHNIFIRLFTYFSEQKKKISNTIFITETTKHYEQSFFSSFSVHCCTSAERRMPLQTIKIPN